MALLSVHTQSYDVLQRGGLSGTVELEPRNLTEVKLGWKLLLAAFYSQVRRTADMSKDTLFISRFLFGGAFGQTEMKCKTNRNENVNNIKKGNNFFEDFQPFHFERKMRHQKHFLTFQSETAHSTSISKSS